MLSLRSKVTIKILDYYFLNPEAQHYINELARMLGLDPRNTEIKLKEFERAGLFKSEFRGKQRYYFLAQGNPVLEHYRQIFLKTHGLEQTLSEKFRSVKGLNEAYIFGSYARNAMDSFSDIDILAVGYHSILELQRIVTQVQKDTARECNVVNMSSEEFAAKRKRKDPFLTRVFKGKTVRLI